MYDVSIDTTLDIAYHYQNCDQRIKVYQLDQKLGCGHARNVALQYVKGEYIAYLDADDLWKPQKLEKQINFMKEHNVVFSCTNYEVIDVRVGVTST